MPLLIQNGTIVTAERTFEADIFCEGETITAIGVNLKLPPGVREAGTMQVVDATGKFVFPGFIDPHVHIHLPFMGTFAKDTYDSGSRAALVGGTTTLIEMCCPSRQEDPLESFELWLDKARGTSACDFSFHMGVSRFDKETATKLRTIVDRGVASFKVFLAYKDFFGLNDEELFHTLSLAKELGVIVTAHCENETLVTELQQQLLAEGKTGPEWHEPSRPVQVEVDGVHHLTTFAEMTGAHVYIVHTSNEPAVRMAEAARKRGVQVWVETVAPYLVLDDSYAQQKNFEGAKYVMSPPIRSADHQDFLWQALAEGAISTVATDHAPFDFATQKHMGYPDAKGAVDANFELLGHASDFTNIPNGIPSVEHRVNLLYTCGVQRNRIDLQTMVNVASTQAAKLFGLFPKKGTIAVGSDADLVVFDPEWRGTMSVESQLMDVDYCAFEGWEQIGRPDVVTVRGKVQVRNGKFVGELGHGQFLERKPTHF